MPVNTAPESWLSSKLAAMQRQLDEVTRAVGRPTDQIRDVNDNVVTMPGSGSPAIVGRGHDVGISFQDGVATVTDEQGQSVRQLKASLITSDVVGNVSGTHFGDVGTPSFTYNHYGDLHGNSFGFHYGAVGDGTTQNQVNALNVFHTGAYGTVFGEIGVPGQLWNAYVTVRGRCLAEVGQAGGPFFTTYGDVGNSTNFFNLFGTVHAPSERRMKTEIRTLYEAGSIIDHVPSLRWRWRPDMQHADEYEHVGPMVDDIAEVAPWLVRHSDGEGPRTLQDRDLIGVLWAALREERQRTTRLEERIALLESRS
jgi:hypothetical protein